MRRVPSRSRVLAWGVLSAALVLLSSMPASASVVGVTLELPDRPVEPGEVFEAPLVIESSGSTVASYAARLQYNPRVLQIVDVRGGGLQAFSSDPVTDPNSFSSRSTIITANSSTLGPTPVSFTAALVTFRVVGASGNRTSVRLRRPRGGEVVVVEGFRGAHGHYRVRNSRLVVR